MAAAVHEEKPSTSNEAGSGNPDDAPAPFAYNLGMILGHFLSFQEISIHWLVRGSKIHVVIV